MASELKRKEATYTSEMLALGEDNDQLRKQLADNTVRCQAEVARAMLEVARSRSTIDDLEGKCVALGRERDKLGRDLSDAQLRLAQRTHAVERLSAEVDKVKKELSVSALEAGGLKNKVKTVEAKKGKLKDRVKVLETGEVVPPTLKDKVMPDLLASESWRDLQRQLVIQTARKIRDEVQKRYLELDLGFLAPRLSEVVHEDGDEGDDLGEEEEDDDNELKEAAGEGGVEATQGLETVVAPEGAAEPEVAVDIEAAADVAPPGEADPRPVTSDEIFAEYRTE